MQAQWQEPQKIEQATIDEIATTLDLPPIIVAIMVNRGFKTSAAIKQFLTVDLAQLTTPDHFHDMDRAVARTEQAIENEEKIIIYGDYDADGVTSVSILHEAFMSLGIEVDYYVPSRFTDGYGPNMDRYHEFVDQGYQLLITVDNGITGVAEVAYAQSHGLDVIITDHHDLPEQLPEATAIIHPRHPASTCEFGYYSGAGVAFYLAWGLLGDLPQELIDLAAIGTIGDIMPIVADNRIIVAAGLQQMAQDPRIGLLALAQQAKIDLNHLTTREVSFGLVPRLNSLGRVASARPAVELLTTYDETEANKIAQQVEQVNGERQNLVKEVAQAAAATVTTPEPAALVVAGEGWAEGVLGIVASRLVDQYHCPTLVLSIDPETQSAKGSGRSVGEFDLFQALNNYRDHFTKFGGHAGAVGLTLPSVEINGLREHLVAESKAHQAEVTASAALTVDYQLTAQQLPQLTPALVNDLQRYLGPFGEQNPEPVFEFDQFPWQSWQAIGKTGQTLKGRLNDGVELIGFRHGDQAAQLNQQSALKVAGTLGLNVWQNKTKVQITFIDAQGLANATGQASSAPTTTAPTEKAPESTPPTSVSPLAAALTKLPQTNWHWAEREYQVTDLRRQAFKPQLLQQDWNYICFDSHLAQQLGQKMTSTTILTRPEQLTTVSEQRATLFIDLPLNARQLTSYLDVLNSQSLYLLFYTSPQRQERLQLQVPQLRLILKEIYQQTAIAKPQLSQFAEHCQVTDAQLHFGIQVFSELNFVKMDKERLTANRQAPKTPLLNSATFRRQQALQQSYRQLAMGSLNQVETFLKTSQKDR
ncbi:single-stranded-DNA-specific exonuclease RecJ [Lapidilactobacillus wuchangensis]|uniref:single-stranded-DNA-specific exonuclease RecJ n=1 Tax=Lapidilactobacillus wuchangensis TaxID=2486001 RepID=UPI000F796AE7|nr:single-stranded-DNA-specific exonuclease RecJ [Lapidilactobacillus wuchangensis]